MSTLCGVCTFGDATNDADAPISYALAVMSGFSTREEVACLLSESNTLTSGLRTYCNKCRQVQWLAQEQERDAAIISYLHESKMLCNYLDSFEL